jgi:hypothetical protein
MGLFDMLDNPGRAVGIDPEQIDPRDRGAYRGMVLSALGNQMTGGTNMFSALGSARQMMDERKAREMELRMKQQQMAAAQQREEIIRGAFGEQAPGAPGAPMPEQGDQPQGGMQGGPMGGGMDPLMAQAKAKSEKLSNAAMRIMQVDTKLGIDLLKQAQEIFPLPKYGQTPHQVTLNGKPALVAMSDQGGFKILLGLSPEMKLGQPVQMNLGGRDMMVQVGPDGTVVPIQGAQPYEAPTSDMKNYQFAQQDPAFTAWDRANRASGATRVHNSTNINEDAWGKAMGPEIAKMATGAMQAGASAQGTLAALDDIDRTLGDAIVGPLAGPRTTWARVQQMAQGKNPELANKLSATSQAMQGMALIELQTAEFMKGQGPITDNERGLIRRAAGMDPNMTVPEIRAASVALRRQANWRQTQAQATQQRVGQMPGMERLGPLFNTASGVKPPAPPQAAPAGATESPQQRAARILKERQKGKP